MTNTVLPHNNHADIGTSAAQHRDWQAQSKQPKETWVNIITDIILRTDIAPT